MVPSFTAITGNGKYPRAIRELQTVVSRSITGRVPGALVSQTARGTLIQPDGASVNITTKPTQETTIPRWG